MDQKKPKTHGRLILLTLVLIVPLLIYPVLMAIAWLFLQEPDAP